MKKVFLLISGVLCVVLFLVLFRSFVAAPRAFPVPYRLTIEQGQTLFSLSQELKKDDAIRSRKLFEMFMILFGSERTISEGEYYFSRPVSSFELALRISGKQFGIERKKVTFPEGFTAKQMGDRLAATLPEFDSVLFLTLAKEHEGYLFPDTYSFFPSITPDAVVAILKRNFATKLTPLEQSIVVSGRKRSDIIIMASIVEKEADNAEEMPIIAGILWKRLDKGMPLQVDAPFLYTLGKESSELTRKDLASDSPYNTYRNKGLPPAPISNPGLDAIKASINPVASEYWYYLHDAKGTIYYARTYAEHQRNIAKYLR